MKQLTIQSLTPQPRSAARIKPLHRLALEAGHVRLDLVADLALQISKMPIAFRKARQQFGVQRQLRGGTARVPPTPFLNRLAPPRPPTPLSLFPENADPPRA